MVNSAKPSPTLHDLRKQLMAAAKTLPDVPGYLAGIADDTRRADCEALIFELKKATKCEPRVWPGSMIGFGDMHYRYASGHEGDTFFLGFASRKDVITLYLNAGLCDSEAEVAALGDVRHGKGCVYIKRLADIHLPALRKLLKSSLKRNKALSVPN